MFVCMLFAVTGRMKTSRWEPVEDEPPVQKSRWEKEENEAEEMPKSKWEREGDSKWKKEDSNNSKWQRVSDSPKDRYVFSSLFRSALCQCFIFFFWLLLVFFLVH